MNQGICAKVYPEGVQPVKGNNCGTIPTKQAIDCLPIYAGWSLLFYELDESIGQSSVRFSLFLPVFSQTLRERKNISCKQCRSWSALFANIPFMRLSR